jgi:hypothetical protein
MTKPKAVLGKHRGIVRANSDPLSLGRVQAVVPDVTGEMPAGWAMPCFPVAGMFMVPPVGANVWIEFEQGDVERPIWSGCFYDKAEDVPASAHEPGGGIVLQTPTQSGLTISDAPMGGITIRSASGATVTINEAGISLNNGHGASVVLAGSTVDINHGALSVT